MCLTIVENVKCPLLNPPLIMIARVRVFVIFDHEFNLDHPGIDHAPDRNNEIGNEFSLAIPACVAQVFRHRLPVEGWGDFLFQNNDPCAFSF